MRLLLALLVAVSAFAQSYDLILSNGRVVDGTGSPWYRADVGVRGGRIAAIGNLSGAAAGRRIDAGGMVVAPGFIDMMGATSLPLLSNRVAAESKLRQGITTMLAGEGGSVAPSKAWPTFAAYFAALEKTGAAINTVHNVGAAQVRRMVIGDENKAPTPQQVAEMKALVAQAMRDGAVGLSTALIYPPGTYAGTEELVELAREAARFGGVYLTHMRNESAGVLDAIRESIAIGEKAGLPVHIFHLKAAGEENWPRIHDAIALIQSARGRGLDVTADIYPYIRNGLGIAALVHPRHFSAGAAPFLKTLGDSKVRAALRREIEETRDWENWYRHVGRNWDNILVAKAAEKRYEGKSIAEIAKLRGTDDWTTFFDLVQSGQEVSVNPKSMDEGQKHAALRQEWTAVCTDAEPMDPASASGAHPRAFGAFPRILAKYVREDKVISLEGAIRRMTALPANRLRLHDRGRIAPGLAADLVVFDPERVRDTASFTQPVALPEGIPFVIVNGQVAIDQGRFTAANGGAVLRTR